MRIILGPQKAGNGYALHHVYTTYITQATNPSYQRFQEAQMTQVVILVPLLTTFAAMLMILRNLVENSNRQAVRVRVREEPVEDSKG